MQTINTWIDQYYRPMIFSLGFVVLFFAASCTFHDVIPVCHYIFGCDHLMHF